MKTRLIIAAAAASIAAAVAAPVFAQANTPGIDQREANQQARIQQGINSGQLTPGEAARLERGQQHVENMEARAKADGVVTNRERARITQAQNVQSRHIYRKKHNAVHE